MQYFSFISGNIIPIRNTMTYNLKTSNHKAISFTNEYVKRDDDTEWSWKGSWLESKAVSEGGSLESGAGRCGRTRPHLGGCIVICARKQIKNVRRALINSRLRREAELTRPNEKKWTKLYSRETSTPAAARRPKEIAFLSVGAHTRPPRRERERVTTDTHNIIIYVSSYIEV